MRWSDIQFDPPLKMLRQFAALWLVIFGAMAIWQILVRGHTVLGTVIGILALTIGPIGLIRPAWMRYIYVGMTILAFPIGWTVSLVLLAIIFYGVFTPVSLVFRVLGRDALLRLRHPECESYWVQKPAPTDVRRYFKQF
jgi:hypothetical protein